MHLRLNCSEAAFQCLGWLKMCSFKLRALSFFATPLSSSGFTLPLEKKKPRFQNQPSLLLSALQTLQPDITF